METVGKDIVVLDYMKGFSSQFATATCIILGSTLGMPLSTTHCMIGALAGIFVAGKTETMKAVYDTGAKNTKRGEESKMNFATMKKILFWWGITIPCAMSATMVITWILFKV